MLIGKEQGVPQSVRAYQRAYDGAGATTKILRIMENVKYGKGCGVITDRVKLFFYFSFSSVCLLLHLFLYLS